METLAFISVMVTAMLILLLLAVGSTAKSLRQSAASYVPEQIHLSLGEVDSSMYVVWTTPTVASNPYLLYSLNQPNAAVIKVNATLRLFTNDDWDIAPNKSLFTYVAEMTGLLLGQFYQYQVGSAQGMSSSYVFRAKRDFSTGPPSKVIWFGDFGIGPEIALTLSALENITSTYDYDMIMQIGDLAYNLNSNGGATGNTFLNDIQPVATVIPYMAVMGNHEGQEFSCTAHWTNRFAFPGNTSNLWYSVDMGLVHVIGLSTELAFYNDTNNADQVAWLENDLKNVNRTKTPWVVVTGHRPTYCSPDLTLNSTSKLRSIPWQRHNKDCIQSAPIMRAAWESLFYQYGVDIEMWAHVHSYERMNPVYNNQSYGAESISFNEVRGAKAPIVIIAGMAGQQESYAPPSPTPLPWSVFQNSEKAYGVMTAFNSSALLWQQIASGNYTIIDYLWLWK